MNRKKFLKNGLLGLGLATVVPNTLSSCKKDNDTTPITTNTNACSTKADDEGPFFKVTATNNTDMTQIGPGDSAVFTNERVKIKISGKVLTGANCDTPIAGATLHIWHADPDGHYDVKETSPGAGDAVPDTAVQINFRTVLTTNDNGEYFFTTYQPFGYYNRPQHIHFKVNATGFKELTTQLYFEGDPKLVSGNFSDGISQAEADKIDADRKVTLNAATTTAINKEGVFDIKIEQT